MKSGMKSLHDGLRNKAAEPCDKSCKPPSGKVDSDTTRSSPAEMLTPPGPRVA